METIIMTRNSVDSDSSITANNANGTEAKLYDGDLDSKFKTQGANRDSIIVTIDITFKVGSVETEFTFNSLILFKHNVKRFVFQVYQSSSATYKTVTTQQNLAADFGCWTFGAEKTSRVRLILYETQLPNREKEIGELIVARRRLVLDYPSVYELAFQEKVSLVPLANGGTRANYTRFAPNRTQRFGARVEFHFLTRAQYEELICIKNEASSFLWWPYSNVEPEDIWEVRWVGPFLARFASSTTAAGYNVPMTLEEV